MQTIISFLMTIFLFLCSLFPGLPCAVPNDEPKQSIAEIAQVVAIYQDIAKANDDIALRMTSSVDEIDVGMAGVNSIVNAIAVNLMGESSKQLQGMPGTPAAITANDFISATAEYTGDQVTVTLRVTSQTDSIGTRADGPAQRCFYDLQADDVMEAITSGGDSIRFGGSFTLTHKNGRIVVTANANTGKIIAASYSVQAEVVATAVAVSVILLPKLTATVNYNIQMP